MTDPTLEDISQQLEANARVLGLILLLLSGEPFPKRLILEVAEACGVRPVDADPPGYRSH